MYYYTFNFPSSPNYNHYNYNYHHYNHNNYNNCLDNRWMGGYQRLYKKHPFWSGRASISIIIPAKTSKQPTYLHRCA